MALGGLVSGVGVGWVIGGATRRCQVAGREATKIAPTGCQGLAISAVGVVEVVGEVYRSPRSVRVVCRGTGLVDP